MLLSRGPTFCPSQEKGHLSLYILNDVNGSVKYSTGMYGWVYAQKQNQSVGLKTEKKQQNPVFKSKVLPTYTPTTASSLH